MCNCNAEDQKIYNKDQLEDMAAYANAKKIYPKGACYKCCCQVWIQTPKLIYNSPVSSTGQIVFLYNLENGEFERKPHSNGDVI